MSATHEDVVRAAHRIDGRVRRTPLAGSATLDAFLGHRVRFKCECLQKVGAFKARGALNALLARAERGEPVGRVVAFSSGNHAQAVAWAARLLGVRATIVMPANVSEVKRIATAAYGAEVVLAPDRVAAEAEAARRAARGATLIPPFDDDDVLAGQGTACLEALQDGAVPDAIFVPCGGGGLLSGTYLAARGTALVYGAEPVAANDAARSYRDGHIFRFESAPVTVADGVQTLSLSERTFAHVRRTAGIYEIPEDDIAYWTQWLTHLLKLTVEPTAALGMAAAHRWLSARPAPSTALVILSGGNLSAATRARVWDRERLGEPPRPVESGHLGGR
jgi:threonine dehydratase